MTGNHPTRRCYLCGKPCYNNGCAECLHKHRFASESIRRNRRKNIEKKRRENDVAFVDD